MSAQDVMLKDYFLAIHRLISRGVEISLDRIEPFIQEGFPDQSTQEGYLNYIRTLTVMFDSHHKTEDDIAFPYFRNILADTHFDWLFEDHNLITGFIEELWPIVASLEKGKEVKHHLVLLKEILLKIEDRWSQHLGLEEDEFVNLIDAKSTDEERSELFEQFSQYNQERLNPHQLTLPFMLYNLAKQDRDVILDTHPDDWFVHINTPEWKYRWQSMSSFFLRD